MGLVGPSGRFELWDEDILSAITFRQTQVARAVGALEQLPLYLNSQAVTVTWRGDFPAAALLVAEFDAVCEATGSRMVSYAKMLLAALRGSEAEVGTLTKSALEEAATGGQGVNVPYANWVTAILCNAMGRYQEALSAALQATEYMPELFVCTWAVPDLIEAAARAGNTEVARGALERLSEMAQAGGTDLGLGLEARSRAVLSEGEAAERFYREAVDRLSRTRLRPSSPAPTFFLVSGCAASGGGATPGCSCVRPTRCSRRWAWRRSRSGPGVSYEPPARPPANAVSKQIVV